MEEEHVRAPKTVSLVISETDRTVKVKWKIEAGAEYTQEDVRRIFSSFGDISDLVFSDKKKNGMALVSFASIVSAVSPSAPFALPCGFF